MAVANDGLLNLALVETKNGVVKSVSTTPSIYLRNGSRGA